MLREWEKKYPGPHRLDLQRARQRRAVASPRSRAVRLRRRARDRRRRRRTATSRSTSTRRSSARPKRPRRSRRGRHRRHRHSARVRRLDAAVPTPGHALASQESPCRARVDSQSCGLRRRLAGRAFAAGAAQSTRRHATPTLAGARSAERAAPGGYVLYFRHTATDFGQNDEQMTGFEDCANQRNLTDGGRADARAIGAAIRSLGIPIGDVLASPFCRTRETAELIFGRATVVARRCAAGPRRPKRGRYAELKLLLARNACPATSTSRSRATAIRSSPSRARRISRKAKPR